MSLLRVEGLRKSFGGVQAVQGVSFALAAGELLALIGPNGAGKEHLLQHAGRADRPDAGRVLLAGQEHHRPAAARHLAPGCGPYLPDCPDLRQLHRAAEPAAGLLSHDRRGWRWWRRAGQHRVPDALALLEQVGMQDQADRPCSELGLHGDVKRVELAMVPGARAAPAVDGRAHGRHGAAERLALMRLVQRLARAPWRVLFTEHSMDVVAGQADRVAVLVRSQLLRRGRLRPCARTRVQAAYLGGGWKRRPVVAASPALSQREREVRRNWSPPPLWGEGGVRAAPVHTAARRRPPERLVMASPISCTACRSPWAVARWWR